MASLVSRLLQARLRTVLIVSGATATVLAALVVVLVNGDWPASHAAAAQAAPRTAPPPKDRPRDEPTGGPSTGKRTPEPSPAPSPEKTRPPEGRSDSTADHAAAPKKKKQYRVVRSGSCQASYYSEGQTTASGEPFDPSELTAAHRTLPMGTRVRVTNKNNGRSVVVRINDRGPFAGGRCLDLSRAAMSNVGGTGSGVIPVRYEVLSRH